jgi:hypothetical protein
MQRICSTPPDSLARCFVVVRQSNLQNCNGSHLIYQSVNVQTFRSVAKRPQRPHFGSVVQSSLQDESGHSCAVAEGKLLHVQCVMGRPLKLPSCAKHKQAALCFNDLGPKHALWQRLRRCLLHNKTRVALTAALAKHTDHLQQRAAVLAALQACEKRPLARSRSTINRMLHSIMAYLERLMAPDLPWELKRTEKGLGVYAKMDCTLTLAAIHAQLGRAEVVVLTEEQRARESANPDQHCLVKLGKKLGVVIGPVALFNKP